MPDKRKKVCVVIPAYNEGPVIGRVIREVKSEFKQQNMRVDIIVVDDCSNDDTAIEAVRNGAILISHILNTGAGGATATGLSYAYQNNYDIACTMDADGQHLPGDVYSGVSRLISSGKIDLLIGSRLVDTVGMSKAKIIGNQGLSILTNVLFGVRTTDSQSGLRVFSKQALSSLKWKTSGYEFCSEMLWRAKQQNLVISEYPISAVYSDYSKSKGQNNWNAFMIIKSLLERRFMELFNE